MKDKLRSVKLRRYCGVIGSGVCIEFCWLRVGQWMYLVVPVIWVEFYFRNFFLIFTYLFLGREGEKHQCVVLSRTPPTGDLDQACALAGNQTNDCLVHRPALYPLSHTSQGYFRNLKLTGAVGWIRSGRDWKLENQFEKLLQWSRVERLSQKRSSGEGNEGMNWLRLF